MASSHASDAAGHRLEHLRFYSGAPRDFWPAFLHALAGHAGAVAGLILLRPEGQEWRVAATQGQAAEVPPTTIAALAEAAERDRFAFERLKEGELGLIALRLESGEDSQACVAVLITRGRVANLQAVCGQLLLVADTPRLYQNHRRLQQADAELGQFTGALDLLLLLNAQTRYLAAAMTFCNELATRFRAQRVSLGWKEGRYVRLHALSHAELFERKMEVVQRLEAAMEETLDQDEEILWPAPPESGAITRDHAAFAEAERSPHLLSLPIRIDGQAEGVVLLERTEPAFGEREVRALRLLCDQAARRLADLKENHGWFGRRWVRSWRRGLSRLVGPEHTWEKVGAASAALLLAVLVFVQIPFRVEAPFMIRTEELVQMPAPFDGYLESVAVRVGDEVTQGQTLLKLDSRDLHVEEAANTADLARYRAEADQAQSEQRIGEMRVAMQRAEQARAGLDLVRYRLSRTELKSPFAGVVVGGNELHERLGAPVKRGEVLLKVTRLDALYAELKVDERDAHEIQAQAGGEIAFASRPDLKFPIRVERLEPSAVSESNGNVFLVRARFGEAPGAWWRPGMTGLAKVDAGRRSILWVLTHRAIDFLRLKLWW